MEKQTPRWQKALSTALTIAVFASLILGTYATFSGKLGGATINRWQVEHLTQGGRYFPVLTIFLYAVPVGLLGMPLKLYLRKKK